MICLRMSYAHHQLSQVTWRQKIEYYMPFNLILNEMCAAVNNSIISYNWPKPSIWHHFLFSLTINMLWLLAKCLRHIQKVVQLANKAKLWPHMQSASLVTALHTDGICYMVVMHYYYWLIHIFTAHCRVFTFMLWWCRCVPYVKLCFGHLCVFLNAETSHLEKKPSCMLIHFAGFYIFVMGMQYQADSKSIRIL